MNKKSKFIIGFMIAGLMIFGFLAYSNSVSAKTKEQVSVEKYIKKYSKKKHKAKGVRYVGERGATKKVIKYAKKKQKGKNRKYYKKDVVERFKVTLIDRFGAYITVDRQMGGFIDGVKDDWKPGTQIWIYKVYYWKTGKCKKTLLAAKGL